MCKKRMRAKRIWTTDMYCAAAAELARYADIGHLNKQKCTALWKLDDHGRLVRRAPPHQILLPTEPIPNKQQDGFLPGLELGCTERIWQVHNALMHAGSNKVHQYLTKTMNYNVSRRDVQHTLVNKCAVCMRQQVHRVVTPAVPIRAFWPMQRVQLDFIDCRSRHLFYPRKMQPGNWDCGTKSRMEYKIDYILIAVCVFSAYAWFRPVYNNSQWEVCQEIVKFFNEFGWPQILHTDGGTPFDSRMLVSLCRDHDTFLVHGRPYHPQSQGKVERLIRTLKNLVRKEEDKFNPRQMYLQTLARAVFIYNRTPHSKTGIAPFTAFYGRRPMEGITFRGEWEMNEVEHEAREMVFARRTYQEHSEEGDDSAFADYVQQLASVSLSTQQDEADRDALFSYLSDQQPQLFAEIQALQDHRNTELVKRSIKRQGELKAVHVGDRVVFTKMAGQSLGLSTNPMHNLLVGTVTAEHIGKVMQTYTIKEDNNDVVHQRVPRQNIGIRIPGYTVTEEMKTCAQKNIAGQAQSFALHLASVIGIESPESCIDAQAGFKMNTFAQVPFRDPIPKWDVSLEAKRERQRIQAAEENEWETESSSITLARPFVPSRSNDPRRFQHEELGIDRPQTEAEQASVHAFHGRSCRGCVCDGCDKTLGKHCTICRSVCGLTLCRECHWQQQEQP